jgi:hypothetical protein
MPRAVFTAPAQPTLRRAGVLPFLTLGRLLEGDGSLVADAVPCSVWPAESSRVDGTGRRHSHRGEAHLDFATRLRVPNRLLEVNGERFRIMSATPMTALPHVVLELLLTSGRA